MRDVQNPHIYIAKTFSVPLPSILLEKQRNIIGTAAESNSKSIVCRNSKGNLFEYQLVMLFLCV